MLKLVKYTIAINVILGLLFAYLNYVIWDLFAGNNVAHSTFITSTWNPLTISVGFHIILDGKLEAVQGIFIYFNPFMLFWILMALDIYIILKLQRNS